jgi:putative oxidoreductase
MRNVLAPKMPASASAGLFFVRILVGLAFVVHGYPKIVNPLAWMGSKMLTVPWTGATIGALPDWLQATVAFVEFFGGITLIVGLLTRFAALALFVDMVVACVFVELPHGVPFVASGHTLEPTLAYMVTTFLLLLTGPGMVSLDAALTAPRKAPEATQELSRAA